MATALSIVVPVHNGVELLRACLAAITANMTDADELIVVDDGSTEDVRGLAAQFGTVIRLDVRGGAAAARNHGAAIATRPVLCFLDSDVVVHDDTLARGRALFGDAHVDAAIGSYDDAPAAQSVVSRFKNLAHHYFHQRSGGRVSSFWGACGFVRRDVFDAVGGFNDQRFMEPSIEDVELGWRLTDAGARIVLEPALQVTHLKRWTLANLLRTDLFRRAIPWVRWSLERRRLRLELNASAGQIAAALLVVIGIIGAILSFQFVAARMALAMAIAAALLLNRQLFALLWRKGGVRLFVAGVFLQQLYYLTSLAGVAGGIGQYVWHLRSRPISAASAARPGL